MASTVIAAILSLSDKMSPKLVQVGRNWDNLSKAEKSAGRHAIATIDSMQRKVDKYISSTMRWGTALAGTAIGLGFNEAFDLESYRTQLNTATKDTERAAEVMRHAINLANTTPFEGGDMAAASAALETASLKAETYLTTLGDTAAGVNKQISEVQTQFIKAFATGQTSEFFDSINVSRVAFEEFVKVNKLSTATLADTQDALKRFLDEKFGGSMANLAKTAKGAWSTITGVSKSALAQLVGMGTDGSIRVGSALDMLREKMIGVSDRLVEMQETGQIDQYAREIGSALEFAWNAGEKVFSTLYSYRHLIGTIAAVGTGIWAVTKAMAAYKAAAEAMRIASMLLSGTLAVSPLAVFALGLGAAITLGSTLATTLDDVTAAEERRQRTFNQDNPLMSDQEIEESKRLEAAIVHDNIFTEIITSFPKVVHDIKSVIGNLTGWSQYQDNLNAHANGTQYAPGGLTLLGERGPELVDLPTGSRVYTADQTAKLARGGNTYNITIHVDGASRSDEEIAEMVARRIEEVCGNA